MKIKLYCSGLSYQTRPNAVIGPEQYQLPRLALARLNQSFLPDYSLLLLTGSLMMDKRTLNELVRGLIPMPGGLVLALKSLYDVGLVEVVDFEKSYGKVKDGVLTGLDQHLMAFKDWEAAVAQSVENWRIFNVAVQENLRPKIQRIRQMAQRTGLDYTDLASNYLHDLAGRIQMVKFFAEDALPSPDPAAEVLPDAELFTNHLREHLLSAHYSLALARELKAGVHEWADAAPYYQKLLGHDKTEAPLFELPLPEFSLWHPDKLVKAMTSKAAEDLRGLMEDTLVSGKTWNEAAAQKCLMAIVKIDQGMPSVRRVSAYRKPVEEGGKKGAIGDWLLISDALGSKPQVIAT
ncbi:MAG TPA: hypothetical protein VGH19_13400 [Verrucomicrobiae bacterium]